MIILELAHIEINLTTFRKTIAIREGALNFGVSDASYLRLVNYLDNKVGALHTVSRDKNTLTYKWYISRGFK